ncbi:hypothetical protein ACFL1H_01280 [Nanoarchaeota archaeon]
MGKVLDFKNNRNPLNQQGIFYASFFENLVLEVDRALNSYFSENGKVFYLDKEGQDLVKEKYGDLLPNRISITHKLKEEFAFYGGIDKIYNVEPVDFAIIQADLLSKIYFTTRGYMLMYAKNAVDKKEHESEVYIQVKPCLPGMIKKVTLPFHSARGEYLLKEIDKVHHCWEEIQMDKILYIISKKREEGSRLGDWKKYVAENQNVREEKPVNTVWQEYVANNS